MQPRVLTIFKIKTRNVNSLNNLSKSQSAQCSVITSVRAGSLPEMLIYLPDGGHFSWIPMSFQIQEKVPTSHTDLDNVPNL